MKMKHENLKPVLRGKSRTDFGVIEAYNTQPPQST